MHGAASVTWVTTCGALAEALSEAQRLGFLGARPIKEVIEHSRAFVRALDGRLGRVVDLGSGGGVPGLVIAIDRPDLDIVLIDRRTKRTDFLARMVRRLDLVDRVEILPADVTVAIDRWPGCFEIVVARGFGPPETTLRAGLKLMTPTGAVVISEPPSGHQWQEPLLAELGVTVDRSIPGVVRLCRAER